MKFVSTIYTYSRTLVFSICRMETLDVPQEHSASFSIFIINILCTLDILQHNVKPTLSLQHFKEEIMSAIQRYNITLNGNMVKAYYVTYMFILQQYTEVHFESD